MKDTLQITFLVAVRCRAGAGSHWRACQVLTGRGKALLASPTRVSDTYKSTEFSWMFYAVLASAKLVSALKRMSVSRGKPKGLLWARPQLPMYRALLLMAVRSLAALWKQQLIATTAKKQLSRIATISKV